MIREIHVGDLDRLKFIHQKYYSSQFEFPDFLTHFLCAFTIIDDHDNIILTGGIRTIIECVALTDKAQPVKIRRAALYELLAASQYVVSRAGYDEIHAFIQDNTWMDQLLKAGFSPTKGKSVVIGL